MSSGAVPPSTPGRFELPRGDKAAEQRQRAPRKRSPGEWGKDWGARGSGGWQANEQTRAQAVGSGRLARLQARERSTSRLRDPVRPKAFIMADRLTRRRSPLVPTAESETFVRPAQPAAGAKHRSERPAAFVRSSSRWWMPPSSRSWPTTESTPRRARRIPRTRVPADKLCRSQMVL
eukprot:6761581-Prymnesium_polylepis.1